MDNDFNSKDEPELEDWQKELQAAAEEYANRFLEEEKQKNPLLPDHAIRTRLANSFKEACSLSELNHHISEAIKIIDRDGILYLDGNTWHDLKDQMNRAGERLESVDYNPDTMTLQELLSFSDEALLSIETIARKKYHEKALKDSLSIYAFLSTIKGNYAPFWLRMGIVLQELNESEKAIRAYDLCIEFDPHNIGAHLFSAECFLKLGNKAEAEKRISEGFRLTNEQIGEERWHEPLKLLSKKIK